MRPFDMPPEDFRRYGYQVVDWIADYLAGNTELPVFPRMQPGDLVDSLPAAGPEHGEPMDRILADFEKLVVPAINHWNHPRFHAFFSVSASAPGILGEMLAAAINTNGMLWKSSPANTELEQVVLGWLRQWMDLPSEFFGMIHDTASTSTLHAIAAARAAADPETRTLGARRDLILYTSEHAHSSVEKGALSLGAGQSNVRKIAVDSEYRMKPDALEAAIRADKAAGHKPYCIVSTVGTTSVTSIDPVQEISEIAVRYNCWHHVDAAYGGIATIVPECAWMIKGAERADSLVVNPHKWMFTPIDCSVFYTRRPEVLRQAFSLVPEYLRTAEDPRAVNYMDYGIPLGRRFRALKLWFVMRYFGREKVVAIVREHIRWASELAESIRADDRFEVVAPVPLSLVCFRYKGSDEDNRKLIDAINASGIAFLGGNMLDGRFVIRLAIGNIGTRREDVFRVWEKVQQLAPAAAAAAI